MSVDSGALHLFIRVSGRVQGVGFRHFVVRRARLLSLSGWVCNEFDGSVLIAVRGATKDVSEFVQAVETGPSSAHVELVSTEDISGLAGVDFPEPFEVRY